VLAQSERGRPVGLFRALVIGLFIVCIPVALITTNIRAAISEQGVYDYAVRHFDADEASGIPEPELIRANAEIRDYLTDGDGVLSISVTNNLGVEQSLFNVRETAHMADVRDLVRAMFSVQVVALALLLFLAVVMLVLWPPRALAAATLYGSILTCASLGVVGLLAASGFDSAWSQFRVIAFTNDFWELDPRTDHLIQMFPESFWQQVTLLIGGVIFLEALVIAAASGVYLRLSRSSEQPIDRPHPDVAGGPGHGRSQVGTASARHVAR
jgi:integral membrane protein (TIGR01906 family)